MIEGTKHILIVKKLSVGNFNTLPCTINIDEIEKLTFSGNVPNKRNSLKIQ